MKPTSENPGQTQKPSDCPARQWVIGDFYRDHEKQYLILGLAPDGHCRVLDHSGLCNRIKPIADWNRVHNTGLQYTYQNREQVARDFVGGFFTPYFEIL